MWTQVLNAILSSTQQNAVTYFVLKISDLLFVVFSSFTQDHFLCLSFLFYFIFLTESFLLFCPNIIVINYIISTILKCGAFWKEVDPNMEK